MNKEKELYRRVDEILHYVWDPIGVKDIPGAREEYYSYLPKVHKLLLEGHNEVKISDYLLKVESGSIGMTENKAKAIETAQLLIKTKEYFEEL